MAERLLELGIPTFRVDWALHPFEACCSRQLLAARTPQPGERARDLLVSAGP